MRQQVGINQMSMSQMSGISGFTEVPGGNSTGGTGLQFSKEKMGQAEERRRKIEILTEKLEK